MNIISLIVRVFLCLALFAPASLSWALDMDSLVKMFERDAGRISPLDNIERYKTIIEQSSGMEVRRDIKISIKTRGDVRQDFFEEYMGKISSARDIEEKGATAYEFFLKKMELVKQEFALIDYGRESAFSGMAGLYDFKTKELLIMKGASHRSMSDALFHELTHAAQDSVVDLENLGKEYGATLDGRMALASMVEGQVMLINSLVRMQTKEKERDIDKDLEDFIKNYEEWLQKSEFDNIFVSLQVFPYSYGFIFSGRNYLMDGTKDFKSMLKRVPLSSEQVMHHEKFTKNEKPKKTALERRKNTLGASWAKPFCTTAGEFYIREIFNQSLKAEGELNKKAAAGWGGDHLCVMENSGKYFLVWDTLWDSAKDASEFLSRYEDFSKSRFKDMVAYKKGKFNIAYPKKNPHLLVMKKNDRVLILEGEFDDNVSSTIFE